MLPDLSFLVEVDHTIRREFVLWAAAPDLEA
jgi:hypothetical protein